MRFISVRRVGSLCFIVTIFSGRLGRPQIMKLSRVNCALGKVSSQMHNATQNTMLYNTTICSMGQYNLSINVKWVNILFNKGSIGQYPIQKMFKGPTSHSVIVQLANIPFNKSSMCHCHNQ